MNNCIFCKIINKDIPSVVVFEDDVLMAFLDISQSTKGHTLLIPKAHFENVFDIDENTIAHIHKQLPKIAKAIIKAFNAQGVNIVNNSGKVAGQTVFHYHVHIVPRYKENDGFDIIYTNNMNKYSKEDLEEIASQIREQL